MMHILGTALALFITTSVLADCGCSSSKKVAATPVEDASQECPEKYRFDGRKLNLSEGEWKERLTPEQFTALRLQKGEKPYHNEYFDNTKNGIYECRGCFLPVFSSKDKFDAGTGYPTFSKPLCPENITLITMPSKHVPKQGVTCSRCGGYLGILFTEDTGLRYCLNSVALKFVEQ